MTTRVSLDVTAVPSNPAGAGRYVLELARHLVSDERIDLLAIARKSDSARWSELGEGECG